MVDPTGGAPTKRTRLFDMKDVRPLPPSAPANAAGGEENPGNNHLQLTLPMTLPF